MSQDKLHLWMRPRTSAATAAGLVVAAAAACLPAAAEAAADAREAGGRSSGAAGAILLIVVPLAAATAPMLGYLHRRRSPLRPGAAPEPAAGLTADEGAAGEAEAATSIGGLRRDAPVIGYVTEPLTVAGTPRRTPEQDIVAACARAGWHLVDIARDRQDGPILGRPSLSLALHRIAAGDAEALVVNDARLLSRAADFASFVKWFRDRDATLIALDLGLDSSTPDGSRVMSALITLNGWAGQWLTGDTRAGPTQGRPPARHSGRGPARVEQLPAKDRRAVNRGLGSP